VSEGKIAQQVGIQPSDILIKLGDVEITSVESYMKALSKFKKGDTTVVQYQRGAQNLQSQITFK
jgi:S1-C subfamily serine protease